MTQYGARAGRAGASGPWGLSALSSQAPQILGLVLQRQILCNINLDRLTHKIQFHLQEVQNEAKLKY